MIVVKCRSALACVLFFVSHCCLVHQVVAAEGVNEAQSPLAETAAKDTMELALSLEARLIAIDSVRAQFEQQVTNARGGIVEQSSGTLLLAKPNFRWDVEAPFPQTIVATASELKIYDPDLEQVTVRDIAQAPADTPLALLTSSDLNLTAQYHVDQSPRVPDRDIFILTPKASDALFARLEVVFAIDSDHLEALVILDHTGQQTIVRFTTFATEQVLQSDVFQLDYPPDTDVVRG